MIASIQSSSDPLGAAVETWERSLGTRAGLSEALLELEREGWVSLETVVGDGALEVLRISRVARRIGERADVVDSRRMDRGVTEMQDPARDNRKVFVIHGRNEGLRRSMFEFLWALDLRPVEWIDLVRQYAHGSPYIGDLLDYAFSTAQGVVVLMTPDERVELTLGSDREEGFQARPNVIFEAGMALARDPKRTVIVEVGLLRPFSDVAGRHKVRLDDDDLEGRVGRRQDLAQRLQAMGCPVRLEGQGWHNTGSFRV